MRFSAINMIFNQLMLLFQFLSIIAIIAIIAIITTNVVNAIDAIDAIVAVLRSREGTDGTNCAAVVERVDRRKCSQGRCGGEQRRRRASRAIRVRRAVAPEERRQSRATRGGPAARPLPLPPAPREGVGRAARKLVELRSCSLWRCFG